MAVSASIPIAKDEVRLADILEGYRTERARDGGRALKLWRALQPDLILLDLMLPVLDGLEVARRVRAESAVPIIMLTARDDEKTEAVGQPAQAQEQPPPAQPQCHRRADAGAALARFPATPPAPSKPCSAPAGQGRSPSRWPASG